MNKEQRDDLLNVVGQIYADTQFWRDVLESKDYQRLEYRDSDQQELAEIDTNFMSLLSKMLHRERMASVVEK
ncbi:MAG: hypothetical protein PXY39_02930 [archaeon]|nr:hypothetical protein [archaeon]